MLVGKLEFGLQNSRFFFFSKSVKKSVKRGVRVLGSLPSLALFSASFQTFLTARAYLNAQKYGLFCSLIRIIPL